MITCIFGCQVGTPEGVKIKHEMLQWLTPHYNVKCIDVDLSCKNEYPFLCNVIMESIRTRCPVLYLHTKGACNPASKAFLYNQKTGVHIPSTATQYDSQRIVRNMWKYEFTKNMNTYLSAINTNSPTVACPYTNSIGTTWHNGFFINPSAAYELTKTFHNDSNRYYFERMFHNHPTIKVIGIRMNDVERDSLYQKNMWQDIWDNFYTLPT